jgi:hypothetical protein
MNETNPVFESTIFLSVSHALSTRISQLIGRNAKDGKNRAVSLW